MAKDNAVQKISCKNVDHNWRNIILLMKCILFPFLKKLNHNISTLWPYSLLCTKILLMPITELHSCLYKICIPLSYFTAVSVNESCFFNEQCETSIPQTECRDGRCICRFDKTPIVKKDGSIECMGKWFIFIYNLRKWNIIPEDMQWYTYLRFLSFSVYLFCCSPQQSSKMLRRHLVKLIPPWFLFSSLWRWCL